jgi:hypothetical protein
MKPIYKVEVTTDGGASWAGNGLTFPTRAEADAYARDLMSRWLSVTDWRVVISQLNSTG